MALDRVLVVVWIVCAICVRYGLVGVLWLLLDVDLMLDAYVLNTNRTRLGFCFC